VAGDGETGVIGGWPAGAAGISGIGAGAAGSVGAGAGGVAVGGVSVSVGGISIPLFNNFILPRKPNAYILPVLIYTGWIQ